MLSTIKGLAIATALGISAVAVTAGIASAAPDLQPLIDTTCNYSQVTAALNAEAPDLAKELAAFPPAQARLQRFLAAPVDQREQMAQQALAAHPQWQTALSQGAQNSQQQQDAALLIQVASTCSNY